MIELLVLLICSLTVVFTASALYQVRKHPRMPHWLQYDHETDVLRIYGVKYAADLFGRGGVLGPPGTMLRVEQGPSDVVTLSKVQSLPVNDNSVFVLNVHDHRLTTEQYTFLRDSLRQALGRNHKILVLDKGLSLTVI